MRYLSLKPAERSLPFLPLVKYEVNNHNTNWITETMECVWKQNLHLRCGLQSIFKELNSSLIYDINFSSQISKWANHVEKEVIPLPPQKIESPFPDSLPMKRNLTSVVNSIVHSDVTIIEAPTGTGKSIQMPCAIQHVVKMMAHDDTGLPKVDATVMWKALHLVPSGEQVVQLHQICSEAYTRAAHEGAGIDTRISFGLYTSALDENGFEQKCVNKDDNYVFATTFSGKHIFDGSLFALVIDEIHEMTPDLMFILWRIRKELQKDRRKRLFSKVILLSATLRNGIRNELIEYLEGPESSVFVCRFINRQYHVATESVDEDNNSLDTMYDEEEHDGKPNLTVLNERGKKLIKGKLKEWMQDGYMKNKNPGILSFHPGQSDLNHLRSAIAKSVELRSFSLDGYGTIDLKKVCGKDRTDLPYLRKPYYDGEPIRMVFSTALLATGVTVYGVSSVIDNGTIKIPGPYCRKGIFKLELIWEDEAMRSQKKGRVGRLCDGTFYELFSKKRSKEIENMDLTIIKLDRAYRTNNVPFFLNILPDILIQMNDETWNELLHECATLGMIEQQHAGSGITFSRYSYVLANAFSIPLDQSDFLVRGKALNIGLICAVYLASRAAEHSGLRKASWAGKDLGREDSGLPINYWAQLTGQLCEGKRSIDSDIETITEATLNLMLCRKAKWVFEELNIKPKIYIDASTIEHLQDAERIDEMYRYVCIFGNGLRVLGLISNTQDIFNELKTSMEHHYVNGCSYYRLKSPYKVLFRAVILASFGQHLAVRAPPEHQKESGKHIMYYVPGDAVDTTGELQIQLCQGEMAVETDRELAVYDILMRRSQNDWFLNGPLHYVDAEEYVVYGNVLGAERDEADWKTFGLKIQTACGPAYFKFKDARTLEDVLNMRLLFKYLPECVLFHKEDSQEYTNLIQQMILRMDMTYQGSCTERAQISLENNMNFNPARVAASSGGRLLKGTSTLHVSFMKEMNETKIERTEKKQSRNDMKTNSLVVTLPSCRSSSDGTINFEYLLQLYDKHPNLKTGLQFLYRMQAK